MLLLETFLNTPGQVLTSEQLQERIYSFDEAVASNALNVHLHHLRQKLGQSIIVTVRGLGYKLGPPVP